MASSIQMFSKFWKELKRRNVVRRNTVYAATAFVILELVSIVQAPLNLPEWSLQLVIILLCVGLVVSIVVSWIYDFNPEGNLVKTKPLPEEGKQESRQVVSSAWKFASYGSFVVIVALILLNIVPQRRQSLSDSTAGTSLNGPDKSIAVLPFINDSPDQDNAYFINGTMEAILDNLSKIEDLRVVSRTSVEKYRDAPKSIPEIAKEMQVGYVLEGSGQKYGNSIRVTIQLIDAANDQHVWSSPYSREIDIENVFALQSEIAQLVAQEIEAVITPEEKQRIEKVPTTSQTAYDLYQRAGAVHGQFTSNKTNQDAFDEAVNLYHYALEYDSLFALAHLNLGWLYWSRFEWNNFQYRNYKDSALQYSNFALACDPQLAGGYTLRGYILRHEGKTDQALKAFDSAIEYNPNDAGAYKGKGWLYHEKKDYVNTIDNFYRSTKLDLNAGALAETIESLGFAFALCGFKDVSTNYYKEALKLDGDSMNFYWHRAFTEQLFGNLNEALEFANIGCRQAPDYRPYLAVAGKVYLFKSQFEEAHRSFERFNAIVDSLEYDDKWFYPWNAFAYLKNGDVERAEKIVNKQINQSNEWIAARESGYSSQSFFLALAYAVRGDRDSVISNLKRFNELDRMDLEAVTLKTDPILDWVRDDPEFIRISEEMEAKYKAEHERVRKWLVVNDML